MTTPQIIAALRVGFGLRSAVLLGLLGALYGAIALFFPFLVDWDAELDYLLGGIWAVMTAALLFDPNLARDGKLMAVALVGGLVIEGWGTNTQLWTYWTAERPPLWILPAWPIAAVCIERLTRLTNHLAPWLGRLAPAYWVVIPGFIVAFLTLMQPAILMPSSIAVILVMLAVALIGPRPRRDLVIFIVGALAGIFLEYWGTSRGCWTYWTGEVPPYQAVLAHGFASIAFARGVQLLEAIGERLGFAQHSEAA